ncbi:UNVERIFIED_CONTAM: hypothetical protein FKN15_007450 [Acipenser sinensis]
MVAYSVPNCDLSLLDTLGKKKDKKEKKEKKEKDDNHSSSSSSDSDSDGCKKVMKDRLLDFLSKEEEEGSHDENVQAHRLNDRSKD